MADINQAASKKIQTLVQIAAELRQGKDFSIARLTLLKNLCSAPEATAQFGLHLARKTQTAMKARSLPRHIKPETWQRYQRLVGKAVRGMTRYLKDGTNQSNSSLRGLLREIRGEQNEFEHQRWGAVRIIRSMELLVVETALECVLTPWASSALGYQLARQYAERHNSRYGTGLIPASAPMMEEIAEFWGRHFLGRSWKNRLASTG